MPFCKRYNPMRSFIIFLSAFLCATLYIYAQPQVEFAPGTRQELGTLLWHTPHEAVFTLTNKSTRPLVISDVHPDCGCTDARWTTSTINPGATGTITLRYDAELLGHFNKNVAITARFAEAGEEHAADEMERTYYVTIGGEVSMTKGADVSADYPYQIGDIYLSTDDVEFDDVHRGELPEKTLYVFNNSKKSYAPSLMHLPRYLIAEASPQVIRPGRTGRVVLKLNSDLLPAMGLTQTSIYLSLFPGDRVKRENEINVSATLLPEFINTPSSEKLAPICHLDSTHITLPPLGKKKRVTGQLTLRNDGKTPLVISALQVYNPGLGVSIGKQKIMPGESEKIKITVNANSHYFKGRRRVLLITNDPAQPKTVIDVIVGK